MHVNMLQPILAGVEFERALAEGVFADMQLNARVERAFDPLAKIAAARRETPGVRIDPDHMQQIITHLKQTPFAGLVVG
jgi:hypothetical protein